MTRALSYFINKHRVIRIVRGIRVIMFGQKFSSLNEGLFCIIALLALKYLFTTEIITKTETNKHTHTHTHRERERDGSSGVTRAIMFGEKVLIPERRAVYRGSGGPVVVNNVSALHDKPG